MIKVTKKNLAKIVKECEAVKGRIDCGFSEVMIENYASMALNAVDKEVRSLKAAGIFVKKSDVTSVYTAKTNVVCACAYKYAYNFVEMTFFATKGKNVYFMSAKRDSEFPHASNYATKSLFFISANSTSMIANKQIEVKD